MPRKQKKKTAATYRVAPYSQRSQHYEMDGYVNIPEFPHDMVESPLKLQKSWAAGATAYVGGPYKSYHSADAPSVQHMTKITLDPWDSRLYATCYAKFVDSARQGSAEWGMNVVQGRKALSTFIQLSLLSATTIAGFVQVNKKGLAWLRANPQTTPKSLARLRLRTDRQLRLARLKAERRRLSNLSWTLDQVSGTLLAYRYGVLPLMTDLSSTATILSSEFDERVKLKEYSSRAWSSGPTTDAGPATGRESVSLKATVSVSNPNLLLANRLGIINPQLWIWDATPWSFVVDWWFPVGRFLGNFTALVGLKLDGASITRSRWFESQWKLSLPPERMAFLQYTGDRHLFGRRKERVLGSLPIPLTVPYGTGLGIQRGQNALALAAQLLTKGRK